MLTHARGVMLVAAGLVVLFGIAIDQRADASAETVTTTLHPGWNLIGWIDEQTAVEAVFEQLPALESIRGDKGRAVRSATRVGRDTLSSLEPGYGYWFDIGSDQPIEWRRNGSLSRTTIVRPPGHHLVAWHGRDGLPLTSAVRGIAESARMAWRWDAAQQRWHLWNSGDEPTTRTAPPLNLGDGLGLALHAPIEWRQPTGVLPPVEFLGDVPQQIRAEVIADLRYVTRYFAERFGVEADPERLRILIARSAAELTGGRTPELEGQPLRAVAAPSLNPDHPSQIVMSMHEWAPSLVDPQTGRSYNGRVVLLHEYFHIVQSELAGPQSLSMPDWLIEGGPTWLMHEVGYDPGARYRSVEGSLLDASQLVIRDRDRRQEGVTGDHALGLAATKWLVERHGADSYFAYWRNLSAKGGTRPSWQEAFQITFGLSLDAFYDEFEAWIRRSHPFVEGQVTVPPHIRPEDVRLSMLAQGGLQRRVELEPDGAFRVALPANHRYHVHVGVGRSSCTGYRTDDGGIGSFDSAAFLELNEASIRDVAIRLPQRFCAIPIDGTITTPKPDRVKHLKLTACALSGGCASAAVQPDGSFELNVPRPDTFLLSISDATDSCRGYVRDGELTALRRSAQRFRVDDAGLQSIEIRAPNTLCGSLIRGHVPNLASKSERRHVVGISHNGLRVTACVSAGGSCTHATVAADGSFELAVPSDAPYDLRLKPSFWPSGLSHRACDIDYPEPVRAGDADLSGIHWDVPSDFCRWRVAGSLTTPDGTPFSRFPIAACVAQLPYGGWICGGTSETDADGSFSLYIPYGGSFAVRPAPVSGCGGGENEAYHLEMQIDGADVTGVRWVLPDDVCSVTASLKRGDDWDPLPH